VSGSYGVGPHIPVSGGSAILRRLLARAEACPIAGEMRATRESLCAGAEGGVVFASADGIVAAESVSRGWAAVTLSGRARVALGPVAFFELEARMIVPLVRDRYYFRPDSTIYEPAAVAAAGSAAAGVRFW
jgi:hypothetical protein